MRKNLINIIKRHNENPKKIREAIQIVVQAGGVKYAHQRMMEIKNQALELLRDIKDSEAKAALIGLVEYTTLREK
jgi:octaprenyl-diphosphate synthase